MPSKSIFLMIFLLLPMISSTCTDSIMDTKVEPPPGTDFDAISTDYTVIELDISTGARCLDGSNYVFYFKPGTESKKFMFYFPGGGFCGYENMDFLDSCAERSQGTSGSSQNQGINGTLYSFDYFMAYFSSNETDNPLFANWNKVFLLACDGTIFQGYRPDPIYHLGTNLYFRGYNNTIATLEYARKYLNLFDAEEVIVIGNSSGGQAMLIWIEYFRKYLPSNITLRGISDAGIFPDVVNQNSNCRLFRKNIMILANFSNSQELEVYDNCYFKNDSENFYKCMIPQYFLPNISIDLFFINSLNDFEVLRSSYGLHCLKYGLDNCSHQTDEQLHNFRQTIFQIVMKLKQIRRNWGFWLRRCIEHFYVGSRQAWMGNYKAYSAEGYQWGSIRDALYAWYSAKQMGETYKTPDFIDLNAWQDACPLYESSS